MIITTNNISNDIKKSSTAEDRRNVGEPSDLIITKSSSSLFSTLTFP